MLLNLRENDNVTISATRIMSEKVLALPKLDKKIFSSMIGKPLKNKFEIDAETLMILNSKSPFFQCCLRFCDEKTLSNFIKTKSGFIEPEERLIGYDHETRKVDIIQFVLNLSSLRCFLQHEDVLGTIFSFQGSSDTENIDTFNKGYRFKNNLLSSTSNHQLRIILHHDGFGISNPLGNKVKKYKTSEFYFCLGNIPP